MHLTRYFGCAFLIICWLSGAYLADKLENNVKEAEIVEAYSISDIGSTNSSEMSALVYGLLTLVAGSNLHCSERREISPCTCRQEDFSPMINNPPPMPTASNLPILGGTDPGALGASLLSTNSGTVQPHTERIEVECERMQSFQQVAEALTGKFTNEQQITLRVSHSQLKDISDHGFKALRMAIVKLELNYDGIGAVGEDVFAGMSRTQYLSLADNEVPEIPKEILMHLNLLRTLDLSRNHVSRIGADDFKFNPMLQHLFLAGNAITEMVSGSLPQLIKHLHVGRNHLVSLNRTLRDLNQLEWLLINANELTSLDGELPVSGHNLKMIYAADNKLTHLPTEFRFLHRLDSLFLQHNRITRLDGTLQKARKLKFLELSYNNLQVLAEEDFLDAEMLEDLELGHNSLTSLGGETTGANSALYPLKSLKCLNLTHNNLNQFSFSSIRGLRELRLLDLSNNKISRLMRGRRTIERGILSPVVVLQNLVEEEGDDTAGSSIQDIRLQHNEIRNLEGSLFLGMKELQRLNLSHNALGPAIALRDLRGLESLRVLDLSYNELITLEDTSETWLPALEELNVAHNRLVILSERDFRGFPGLCWVDMSANQISTLKPELVSNTRCTVHGVPDVLRIYLQDNPVLCDAGLADLTVALEVNHAKVFGVANDCPTPPPPLPETTMPETTPGPPLPPTLLLADAVAASSSNVSFAATLE
ncbi:insulin-like growth factor-binding protein complex acid labile subunit [Copidosoma floridanum]|uniref:insulin-like growth factor-binding protein complex acid labile subunit n=1 Tax=Copidosoma floridanum TaxID=29053 RepID=UPI0006C9B059|nr:insulin-like growth factor-binding protein complex acid labile subunit [Copidosoma floridanum]